MYKCPAKHRPQGGPEEDGKPKKVFDPLTWYRGKSKVSDGVIPEVMVYTDAQVMPMLDGVRC